MNSAPITVQPRLVVYCTFTCSKTMFDQARSLVIKAKVLYLGVPKHQSSRIRDQYSDQFDIDVG